MSFARRPVSAAVFLLAVAAQPHLAAQAVPDGPYWSARPSPANLLSLSAFGTTLLMRTTTHVECYSAVTRAWVAIPVSLAALTWNFNSYVVVQDGNTFYGYTSRTGAVATLTTAPGAVISNGPSASGWVTVVRDGAMLWGFASLADVAQWVPNPIASTAPQLTVGSHVALVNDGVAVHAFSSYFPTWVSTPAPAGTTLTASNATGLALSPGLVSAYSALTHTWATTPFVPTGAPTIGDGFAVMSSSTTSEVLAFSALQGTFAVQALSGPGFTVTTGRNVAVVVDGATVFGFAPGVSQFASLAAPGATVQAAGEFAIITTGAALVAFSGLTGAFSAALTGNYVVTTNEDVALAQSSSGTHAYSAVLNAWTPAPAVTFTSGQLVRNAVILVRSGGYEAFAARTGQWSTVNTAVTGAFTTSTQGSTFVASDGNAVIVFDSRYGRWVSVTTAAPAAVAIWRLVAVAHDGVNAYGFSQNSSTWDTIPLSGPVVQQATNSALAYLRTAQSLYVYSGMGSLSTLSRFPEFSRLQPRGTPLRVLQAGPAGSAVTMAVSLAAAPAIVTYPVWGPVYIDLSQIVLIFPLGTIPGSGVLDVAIPLPNDPALNNVTLHLQDIVVPPAAAVHFSNAIAPIII